MSLLAAKRARLDERSAAEQQRRAALDTVIPELLRTGMNAEDVNSDEQTAAGGSDDYLDLLLDEEETFICEYRQRLIDDGFWR